MEISFRGKGNNQQIPLYSDRKEPYRPVPTKARVMPARFQYKIVLFTLCLWLITINYLERSYIKSTIKKCDWSKWENWQSQPHRIALFADPQIMDDHSYPGRPALINYLSKKWIDNYHRRNWEYVNYYLDSDSVIFLGDLFDGGRNWDNGYWYDEFKRFNSIYHKIPDKQIIMSVPGNHDIGFGETVEVRALERFKAFFGQTSSVYEIGNHTVVLLDTISLSDFGNEFVTKDPQSIMDRLAPLNPNDPPRILMTHVPLFRDPATHDCGPLRESNKKFPIMKGVQYQTVIDHNLSQEILSKIRPKISFSGDDHDYCRILHTYGEQNTAEEITVKSCSMNMGIKRPAIQLLSLNTNEKQNIKDKTYQTEMCYLPDPYFTLKTYLFTAVLSLLIFVIKFLSPKTWTILSNNVNKLLPNDSLTLPVTDIKQVKFENFEKDLSGFLLNGSITILGVLVIFITYFDAFYN